MSRKRRSRSNLSQPTHIFQNPIAQKAIEDYKSSKFITNITRVEFFEQLLGSKQAGPLSEISPLSVFSKQLVGPRLTTSIVEKWLGRAHKEWIQSNVQNASVIAGKDTFTLLNEMSKDLLKGFEKALKEAPHPLKSNIAKYVETVKQNLGIESPFSNIFTPVEFKDKSGKQVINRAGGFVVLDARGKELIINKFKELEKQNVERLGRFGIKLPGYKSGDLTPVSDALSRMLETLSVSNDKTLKARISKEGVIDLDIFYSRTGKSLSSELGAPIRLSLGLGERIPVLPKIGEVSRFVLSESIPRLYEKQGTDISSRFGRSTTVFGIHRAIAYTDVGKFGSGRAISEVVPASVFYLRELSDLLSADTLNVEVIKRLEEVYRETIVHPDQSSGRILSQAHKVIPVSKITTRTGPDWIKTLPAIFKEFPGFYTSKGLSFKSEVFTSFSERWAETVDEGFASKENLYLTTVKPESVFQKGVLSALRAQDIMPFGQFEDPARRIDQYLSVGRLAGGKYLHGLKKNQHPYSFDRLTVPHVISKFQFGVEMYTMAEAGLGTRLQVKGALIKDPFYLLDYQLPKGPQSVDIIRNEGLLKDIDFSRLGVQQEFDKFKDLINRYTSDVRVQNLLGDAHLAKIRNVKSLVDFTNQIHNDPFEFVSNLRILSELTQETPRAISALYPKFDPTSGGIAISESLARALTADVTRHLNPFDPAHNRILNELSRSNYRKALELLNTPEGQRVLEKGGLGTHIMINRSKFTVYHVFKESELRKLLKVRPEAEIPHIVLPIANLKKYPGMLADTIMSAMLEKAFEKTASIRKQGPGSTDQVVEHLTKYAELAESVGAEFRLTADVKALEKLASRRPQLTESEFISSISTLVTKQNIQDKKIQSDILFRLGTGYVPQFVLAPSGKAANIQSFDELTKLFTEVSDQIKKDFGVDTNLMLKQFIVPLATEGKEAGFAFGFSIPMQVGVRAEPYELISKFTRVIPDQIYKTDEGFKLEHAALRRLAAWGKPGQDLALQLMENVFSKSSIQVEFSKIEALSRLSEGYSLDKAGKETLDKLGIKVISVGDFIKDVRQKLGKKTIDIFDYDSKASLTTYITNKDILKEYGKGFVLEFPEQHAAKWTTGSTVGLDSQARFSRRQFIFRGPENIRRSIQANAPITQLGRTEEKIIQALLSDYEDRPEQFLHSFRSAYASYESLWRSEAVSKTGSLAEDVLQPRIGGSLWTSIIESPLDEQTVAKYGRGFVRISPFKAQQLGLIDRKGNRLLPFVGKDDTFKALVERAPVQGAGNLVAVNVVVDEMLEGSKVMVDPLVYRIMLGDTDQDVINMMFASTKQLHESLEGLRRRQFSSEMIERHRTSLAMLTETMRIADFDTQKGTIDLVGLWKMLEESSRDKKTGQIKPDKNFAEANRLMQSLQAILNEDELRLRNLHTMRIVSTKLATGPVHNAHELMRHVAENTGIAERFVKQFGGDATEYILTASGILQTAEELASIKKAAAPLTDVLESVQSFAMNPMLKSTQEYQEWRKKLFSAIVDIHEEILGGKGMGLVVFEGLARESARKLAAEKALAIVTKTKLDILGVNVIDKIKEALADPASQARQQIERTIDYFEFFASEIGGMYRGLLGSHISPMAKALSSRIAEAPPGEKASILREVMAQIESLRLKDLEKTRIFEDPEASKNIMEATLAKYMPKVSYISADTTIQSSKAVPQTPISAVLDQAPVFGEETFAEVSKWIRDKPIVKYGLIGAAGILSLAGLKSILFPDVRPQLPPQDKHFAYHNPPMFGYLTAGGVEGVPDLTFGGGAGMAQSEAPSYGPGVTVPDHYVNIGPGLSSERPIPSLLSSGSYVAPQLPVSNLRGSPEIDVTQFVNTRPRARVELPRHMRHLGAYADETGLQLQASMNLTKARAVDFGSRLARSLAAPVELRISDDFIHQSRLESIRAMRNASESRFYFGSTDVGGELG